MVVNKISESVELLGLDASGGEELWKEEFDDKSRSGKGSECVVPELFFVGPSAGGVRALTLPTVHD